MRRCWCQKTLEEEIGIAVSLDGKLVAREKTRVTVRDNFSEDVRRKLTPKTASSSNHHLNFQSLVSSS